MKKIKKSKIKLKCAFQCANVSQLACLSYLLPLGFCLGFRYAYFGVCVSLSLSLSLYVPILSSVVVSTLHKKNRKRGNEEKSTLGCGCCCWSKCARATRSFSRSLTFSIFLHSLSTQFFSEIQDMSDYPDYPSWLIVDRR